MFITEEDLKNYVVFEEADCSLNTEWVSDTLQEGKLLLPAKTTLFFARGRRYLLKTEETSTSLNVTEFKREEGLYQEKAYYEINKEDTLKVLSRVFHDEDDDDSRESEKTIATYSVCLGCMAFANRRLYNITKKKFQKKEDIEPGMYKMAIPKKAIEKAEARVEGGWLKHFKSFRKKGKARGSEILNIAKLIGRKDVLSTKVTFFVKQSDLKKQNDMHNLMGKPVIGLPYSPMILEHSNPGTLLFLEQHPKHITIVPFILEEDGDRDWIPMMPFYVARSNAVHEGKGDGCTIIAAAPIREAYDLYKEYLSPEDVALSVVSGEHQATTVLKFLDLYATPGIEAVRKHSTKKIKKGKKTKTLETDVHRVLKMVLPKKIYNSETGEWQGGTHARPHEYQRGDHFRFNNKGEPYPVKGGTVNKGVKKAGSVDYIVSKRKNSKIAP